ncbi:MAG TPA: diguanylate cyclase [Kofleriaceae bacterium]|nr:diguanylate cyclase [Kofleriaceae bacterium]
MAAPRPANEEARLHALRSYGVLDTEPEPYFDRITRLVARVLEVPIALVSLVDADRQWFKACVGLGSRETTRDVAFCAYAILENDVLVIRDALADPRFATNPLVTGPPFIRAYAGAPLRTAEGLQVGTLCAIDHRSRTFTADQLASLRDLADIVIDELDRRRIAELRAAEAAQAHAGRVNVLEAILETAGEGILVIDEHSQIVIANPLARQVTGRGPGDTLSLYTRAPSALDLFEPDGVTPFDVSQLPLARALRGDACDHVALYAANESFPDGVHLLSTGRPVRDDDGEVRGAVMTLSDVTALRRAQDRVAELAVTDELTGLPNRRALRARLELLSAEAARGRRFSLAVADLDGFKQINDTHGHATGDAVLAAVARTLTQCVRRNDLVARLGGEELCIVQADVDPEQMRMLTERLRAAVAAIREPVAITASFGVCHSSVTADPAAMLDAADRAMYIAKRDGKNRVVVAP